ncbi:RsmB/NOP family class I SAM-dependent RNA methyltransferase [Candidatus Nanohalococcus occultus]|uniref:16S rRNA C967 or C1407 C5-methylase, RsmB/RsmF family n=1 Tax=Candidatus Nanohalococcus occultus TaxID=2978047 RepID=A0ABY8CDR9_9ARCH|nr:16S rRNA C967 or C1407 C5-methylase, RsmB/RsmF family [Candidatus Nanohaloarchaeota archaeon SVXNc]
MERYKSIIDDWEGFKQACETHAVNIARRNRVKSSDDFLEKLFKDFDVIEKPSWNENIHRLSNTEEPGKSLLHWRGDYYVQEESAAIPVHAMNPQEGEKILDMCASPGGKTTQIASRIENNGVVIANDKTAKRLQSLTANAYRTGSTCVTTTNYDGRNFPGREDFDRVLVDAPCSGEGDRARRTFEPAEKEERESLSELQKKLIVRGAELLIDDGVLVYSTCTIAPEENEEVVKHALENTELELEGIEIDLPHSSGLEEFEDSKFGEELRKTIRMYPHHFNSGVIYVAKFRK